VSFRIDNGDIKQRNTFEVHLLDPLVWQVLVSGHHWHLRVVHRILFEFWTHVLLYIAGFFLILSYSSITLKQEIYSNKILLNAI